MSLTLELGGFQQRLGLFLGLTGDVGHLDLGDGLGTLGEDELDRGALTRLAVAVGGLVEYATLLDLLVGHGVAVLNDKARVLERVLGLLLGVIDHVGDDDHLAAAAKQR